MALAGTTGDAPSFLSTPGPYLTLTSPFHTRPSYLASPRRQPMTSPNQSFLIEEPQDQYDDFILLNRRSLTSSRKRRGDDPSSPGFTPRSPSVSLPDTRQQLNFHHVTPFNVCEFKQMLDKATDDKQGAASNPVAATTTPATITNPPHSPLIAPH